MQARINELGQEKDRLQESLLEKNRLQEALKERSLHNEIEGAAPVKTAPSHQTKSVKKASNKK